MSSNARSHFLEDLCTGVCMARTQYPKGLSARGRAFWKSTTDAFDLSDAELELLKEVCRSLDLLDLMADRVELDGLMVTGSTGQLTIHPAVSQANGTRQLVGKLLAQLQLPDESGEAEVQSFETARARKAAQVRWRKHG